ncbi:hypothetical protein Tco_0839128 [Tanacetum coccineum]|uniref:Uncharacterized protein n=1 Tax=Tanacetum coccineum TaxID=301880 RepID=A0ABQ5ATN3_9ASTR
MRIQDGRQFLDFNLVEVSSTEDSTVFLHRVEIFPNSMQIIVFDLGGVWPPCHTKVSKSTKLRSQLEIGNSSHIYKTSSAIPIGFSDRTSASSNVKQVGGQYREIDRNLQAPIFFSNFEDTAEQFSSKEFLPIRSIFPCIPIKLFPLRLSSFLLDGNGIDALGTRSNNRSTIGLRIWITRLNLNNRSVTRKSSRTESRSCISSNKILKGMSVKFGPFGIAGFVTLVCMFSTLHHRLYHISSPVLTHLISSIEIVLTILHEDLNGRKTRSRIDLRPSRSITRNSFLKIGRSCLGHILLDIVMSEAGLVLSSRINPNHVFEFSNIR